MNETTRRIVDRLLAVPPGRVACYRDVARAAGLPNGARQVVRTLHSLSESWALPWHRIIRADGSIALESCRGRETQIALLRSEGVQVSDAGRVDMAAYDYFRNIPPEDHV
ncbi:MAG: MGMT family protein [Spirochaetaceae bacterium]|jgi:methylated-DNA-protein-cysteine methyltransferase-like protein|nr:MGMT family protein [Spirochaetaceae bacterium]